MLTLTYIRYSLKANAEHRVNFLSMIVVGIVWQVGVAVFSVVLVGQFPGIGGWSVGAVLLIAAIRMSGHALATALFFNLGAVAFFAQEGMIDRYLIRPLPAYRQVLLQRFHVPVIGDAIVSVVLMVIALGHPAVGIDWGPWQVLYLAAAVLGTALYQGAIGTFFAAFALHAPGVGTWERWANETTETFGNYPLHILPRPAEAVLTFVLPLAFAAYLPASVLTGHAHEVFVPAWLAVISPAVSAALYLLTRLLWRARLRRFDGTGS